MVPPILQRAELRLEGIRHSEGGRAWVGDPIFFAPSYRFYLLQSSLHTSLAKKDVVCRPQGKEAILS